MWCVRGGADWEQRCAPNGADVRPAAMDCSVLRRLTCALSLRRWSERCPRFVDTEEVTGSNPVSPTNYIGSPGDPLPAIR
jgi:hypothetical protein